MGAVYLGRETALDRDVAIKVLPAERGDAQDHERFRREALTAARLMHPNIVPLHAWNEAGSVPYVVMGYVRGEPLSGRMRRGLSPEAARKVLIDLADALDYAHRHGVVHRDVKPDNVILDDDTGRPMLTDFGVAKAAGGGHALTAAGAVIGTPSYMSPEQAGGKSEIDGRSDIYSLGVMGYAMLAGRLPFEGNSAGEILVQHLTKTAPPLRPLVAPEVPEALVTAIERCLEKDPAARWPEARTLRDALVAAGEEGEDVPDELVDVSGWGLWMAALGLWAAYAGLYWRLSASAPFVDAQSVVLALFVVALLAVNRIHARHGFRLGWRALLRALFLQPFWWSMWYPRAWRRRRDVFDRLPPPYRRARTIMACLWLLYLAWMIPVLVVLEGRASATGELLPFAYVAAPTALTLLLLSALFVQALLGRRWVRERGFGGVEHGRLLWASTAKRALWTRPQMARLLQMDAPAVPATPQACLRAMVAMAARVNGPARPAVDEAVAAAGRLLAAIEASERERTRLAADSDPGEEDRLRARLAAFGPESAAEGEDRRRMRGLLAQQLEVLAAMRDRIIALREQGERSSGALTTLYRLVAELFGGLPAGAGGRVLEGRLRDASAEALRLLTPRSAVSAGAPPMEDLPTVPR
jgi:hypothetical protein